MNANKKIVIAAIVMLLAVFCVMSACKKNIANSGNGEVVVVTDENGVPITDENGEATFFCNGGSVSVWVIEEVI